VTSIMLRSSVETTGTFNCNTSPESWAPDGEFHHLSYRP
jgi:hypothetical protein